MKYLKNFLNSGGEVGVRTRETGVRVIESGSEDIVKRQVIKIDNVMKRGILIQILLLDTLGVRRSINTYRNTIL